ncbi:DUF1643 domain-containing protein [Rummeliibacillus pycnus]|uniref:DUF1643 domain-containing protein n=1 Tax=Rummeliibacillus pycnus TaxID=101070 RepID=UPI0037C4FF9A
MMMRPWKPNENVRVMFDESKQHRLKLICTWDESLPVCLFILLNPNTVELENCDQTTDKCIKIASYNGYGSIVIVNLFSLRTPTSKKLLAVDVRSIPQNIEIVKQSIDETDMIIAAWGEEGTWFNANYPILKYMEDTGKKLYHLHTDSFGWPMHPISIKAVINFKEYRYSENTNIQT